MSEARIFSAFVRNDLVEGQRILVLECLAQEGCGDAWGGEHYEFPFDRIAIAPPHIIGAIDNIKYPPSSCNPGYSPLNPLEAAEVETALTQARKRAALAA